MDDGRNDSEKGKVMRTKAVIFDFDGTLTELAYDFGALRVEIEKIALRYATEEQIAEQAHQYILEMIFGLEAALGPAGERFKQEAFRKLQDLEVEASRGQSVYPFTRRVLGRLKQRGMKMGIITRGCTKAVRTVFPDLEDYVEAVVTRDDTRLLKPHPGQLQMILSLLAVKPDEAVVVGDHPTDIQAGRAMAVRTVALLSGKTNRQAFEEAGADYVIDDIRGLEEVL